MDAFSGEAELLTITTAFHTHDFSSVLTYDTNPLSPENKVQAKILKYRAQIALGQQRDVLNALSSAKDPASQAIKSLAQYTSNNANSQSSALHTAQRLAESDPEDSTVQICAGTVLALASETSLATELLSKHQGNLEAVALLTQIHLSSHRTDLALKEVQAAKRWAQDSLLINLAEAWVNLRVGGAEKYQSCYYVYEELASAPSSNSTSTAGTVSSLVGQAVAEIHLGRSEEAESALSQALLYQEQQQSSGGEEAVDTQALANSIVLASIMGKKAEEVAALVERLQSLSPEHILLSDLESKSDLFDTAAAKYSPAKVAAAS